MATYRLGRFKGYSLRHFRKDLLAGIMVGIVAIPLGLSFAIASGVKPEYGIYTTIVAGILISLAGGSKFQIGGPTGAFVPVLLGVVMAYGYENLLICGLMAGVILLAAGLLRLGDLIRYIPRPVTVGFTSGIAVLIFSGQIANFLGLRNIAKHESFFANMKEIAVHLSTINVYSLLTAMVCLAVILLIKKRRPRLPESLLGLAVSTGIAAICFPHEVATIGSSFGRMTGALPQFHMLSVSWEKIAQLLPPALVIAMLGGIESLLSAVVADRMTDTKHDSNRELIGQGIANIVTPFFGGIPATGAIARTATNIRSGAVSPVSGILHGAAVLGITLLFAPLASSIPLAALAPILMVVAWNMSERKEFVHILRTKSGDSLVMAATFSLTVLTNLTTAVGVGLGLAAVLFIKRMGDTSGVNEVLPDAGHTNRKVKPQPHAGPAETSCPQIGMFTLEGPLFFGASPALETAFAGRLQELPKVLILRLGKVLYLDTTGESHLLRLIRRFRQNGAIVLLTGVRRQPGELLAKTGLLAEVGDNGVFPHTGEALQFAINHGLKHDKCVGCTRNVFLECGHLSAGESQKEGKIG